MAHLGVDAWALCAEFVERIISEAQVSGADDNAIRPISAGEWEQVWRAGDGAPTDEAAIGRIIQAAAGMARTIALREPEHPGPVSAPADEVGRITEGQERPTTADEPIVLVVPTPSRAEPAPESAGEPVTTQVPVPPLTPGPAATETGAVVEEPETTHVVLPLVVPVPAAPARSDQPPAAPAPTAAAAAEAAIKAAPGPPPAATLVEPVGAEPLSTPLTLVGGADELETAAQRSARRHMGWATFFTWIRNLGAIMLLFVVWQLWGTGIAQHQAQSQLKSEFDAALRAHHPPKATGAGPALIPAGVRVPVPANGTVVAEIQIPTIGVDQYVVSGTDAAQLSQGPGHYVGTAVPGQAGNVAIAGHRTTNGAPFNRLGQLTSGDRIILTTTSGEHLTYVVSGTPQAVSPSDVAVLNYFGDNRITLTTCTPEFSAAQRLIVVGKLLAGAAPKVPASDLTYHVQNSATASWDWSLLPVVGLELCILLLLGLSYRRFDGWFGKHGKWFILVPVWAVGLYLLFTSLTTFLPATY